MELTILTWNIWFNETNKQHRTKTILNEIKELNTDIIALQEITAESLDIIKQSNYHIIGTPLYYSYDTIILSKYPPLSWNRYQLPNSKMGRNLLLTTLQLPHQEINIGTFHLESIFSKDSEKLKEEQLQFIEAISPSNSILMGDTNFKNNTKPNTKLIDIFEQINCPQAFNFTYSGKNNKNIKNKYNNSRLDRIYTKQSYKINQFFLTGTETQPSDHFGVFSNIKI